MNHELPMASAVSRQGTGHGTLGLATFDAVYIFLPTSCISVVFLGLPSLELPACRHDDNLFRMSRHISSVVRACPKVKTSSLHMVTAGEDSLIFHDFHIFSRF